MYGQSGLIRLSHTPTTGSMLSNRINLRLLWQSMCLSGAICPFLGRCRSFSACFRMKLRVRPIISKTIFTPPPRDGAMRKSPKPSCPSFILSSPTSKLGCAALTMVSARSIYRHISTNSPTASIHSTRFVPCSASRAMLPYKSSFIPRNQRSLHLADE